MLYTHQLNFSAIPPACTDGADFEINKFQGQLLLQLEPFKNPDDKTFSILLYYKTTVEFGDTGSAGHLFFRSPGLHGVTPLGHGTGCGYYIRFSERFLFENPELLSVITCFPFFEISLLGSKSMEMDASQSGVIKELYERIYAEYYYNYASGRMEMVKVYLKAFFLTVKRAYEFLLDTTDHFRVQEITRTGEIVRKFKSMVWLDTLGFQGKKLGRKSVGEYANMLFIHPNYLYALVKKDTGKAPREYIDEHIFQLAKNLLIQGELTIKEISWQLCFRETAHFSNFFRRHAGIAPVLFRKQYLYATA